MGASLSRRYKYGMRPKKYFRTKIMPEMKETFGILGFTSQHAYQLFKAFIGETPPTPTPHPPVFQPSTPDIFLTLHPPCQKLTLTTRAR